MATLEDLEARVAALEASQADYRAVLAAVNALGANQREHAVSGSQRPGRSQDRPGRSQDRPGRLSSGDTGHIPLGRRAARRNQGPDHRPSRRVAVGVALTLAPRLGPRPCPRA